MAFVGPRHYFDIFLHIKIKNEVHQIKSFCSGNSKFRRP
jgi:hypothetical protein